MNRAYIVDDKKEFNDDEKTLTAWATKETIDRDDEVLKADGWDLTNFRKNPVLMAFHDYRSFPVGKVLWVKPEPKDKPIGLLFKAQFADTPAGNEAYYLYRNGMMNAFSVGFMPLEPAIENEKAKKPRRIYPKNELLEISCVPVPANPTALSNALEDGTIKTKEFRDAIEEFINKDDQSLHQINIQFDNILDVIGRLEKRLENIEANMKNPDSIALEQDSIKIETDTIKIEDKITLEDRLAFARGELV